MRTAELVAILAAGARPLDPHAVGKRFASALFVGLLGATLLLVALFGVRSDMPQSLLTPAFWLKAAFPLATFAIALRLALRLGQPGASVAWAWAALAVPLVGVWLAAAVTVYAAPAPLRLDLVLGRTWGVCSLSIMLLSVPTFLTVFWAMKGLAPTRLVLAGIGAGLLAGAQAASVYTVYCVEMATPFWAVWYMLGILAPAALGGVLGPALLRW